MAKKPYKPSRPDPVASFSDHFGVDPAAMKELGVFDLVLERDSPFAISPRLLDGTSGSEPTWEIPAQMTTDAAKMRGYLTQMYENRDT